MSINIKDMELPSYHPWFMKGDKNIDDLIEEGIQLSKTNWIANSVFGYTILTNKDSSNIIKDQRWHNAVKLFLTQHENENSVFKDQDVALITMEGDQHARLKKMVMPYFTPLAINKIRPYIYNTVYDIANSFINEEIFDIEKEIFKLIPSYTICEILDIPKNDVNKFIYWADKLFSNIGLLKPEVAKELKIVAKEFTKYIEILITQRESELKDDLLSNLIKARDQGDRLSTEEIIMLIRVIISSGIDTGGGQLGLAFKTLTYDKEALKKINKDKNLLKEEISKCLKYNGVIKQVGRIASEDIEYKGVLFPKGTILFISISIPNINEPEQKPLTFGQGIHYCLGASLATALLEETFAALFKVFPNIKISDNLVYSKMPKSTNRAISMPVMTYSKKRDN